MSDKDEIYKNWSLKQVPYSVIVGVKQTALDLDVTLPEALDEIVSVYQSLPEEDLK